MRVSNFDSATIALRPFSNSRPAWADLPRTTNEKFPEPFRHETSVPSGSAGSNNMPTSQVGASCLILELLPGEPISSSGLIKTSQPIVPAKGLFSSVRIALSITTKPPLASATPGPRSVPSSCMEHF